LLLCYIIVKAGISLLIRVELEDSPDSQCLLVADSEVTPDLTDQVLVIKDGLKPFLRESLLAVFTDPTGVLLLIMNEEGENAVDSLCFEVLVFILFALLFFRRPSDLLHAEDLCIHEWHDHASGEELAQVGNVCGEAWNHLGKLRHSTGEALVGNYLGLG
jgi:hypothetical protein